MVHSKLKRILLWIFLFNNVVWIERGHQFQWITFVISLQVFPSYVSGALNVDETLYDSFIQKIQNQFFVDESLLDMESLVYPSSCTSFDRLPCWYLTGRKPLKIDVCFLENTLSDIYEEESFFPSLTDATWWLIFEKKIFSKKKKNKLEFSLKQENTSFFFNEKERKNNSIFSNTTEIGFLSTNWQHVSNILLKSFLNWLKTILSIFVFHQDTFSNSWNLKKYFEENQLIHSKNDFIVNVKENKTLMNQKMFSKMYTIEFDLNTLITLPEYYGSYVNTTQDIFLRWIGDWSSSSKYQNNQSFLNSLPFQSSNGLHIIFSKPVIISKLNLILLQNHIQEKKNISLIIEGWKWNSNLKKKKNSKIWFFTKEPLKLLTQHDIQRCWWIHSFKISSFVNNSLNIMQWVVPSSFQSIEGITFSGLSLQDFHQVGLHSIQFKQVLEIHQPAIVLREMKTLPFKVLKENKPITCHFTQLCHSNELHEILRWKWSQATKEFLNRTRRNKGFTDWLSSSYTYEPIQTLPESYFSRISSDGIVYHWEDKEPFDFLTLLFHSSLPQEASVVSLKEIAHNNWSLKKRLGYSSLIQQLLILDPLHLKTNHSLVSETFSYETIFIKKKLFQTARSAALRAKRLQYIHQTLQEEITNTTSFSFKNLIQTQQNTLEEKKDELFHLFHQQLFLSMKEAVEKHSFYHQQNSKSFFVKKNQTPSTEIQQIIVTDMKENKQHYRKVIRFNLTTGQIDDPL